MSISVLGYFCYNPVTEEYPSHTILNDKIPEFLNNHEPISPHLPLNSIIFVLLASLTFLEIGIGGARLLYAIPGICLIGLAGVLTLLPRLKPGGKPDVPALVSVVAFAGYIIIRNRLSEIEYIARMQLFIVIGALLAYLILTLVITAPKMRRILFIGVIILSLFQLYPALIQFTQGNGWMPLDWAHRRAGQGWRASGFFISPNNFAGFMELASLMAASLALWGRSSWVPRMLFAYASMATAAGVIISGSRGGYLSLTAGLGVILILSLLAWGRQREKNLLGAVAVGGGLLMIVTAGLVWALQSSAVSERIAQINDPENMRLLLWKSALQQFNLSPLLGTGGFSFLYFGRLFRDPLVQNDPIHVHNDYIQLLADYGLVGATLLLLLLGLQLRAGISGFSHLLGKSDAREPVSYGDRLPLMIGALAGLAAYIVHSVVDFNMQLPLNAIVMSMLLGIITNPGGRPVNSGLIDGHVRTTLLRGSIPVIGVLLLIYGIPKIPGEFYSEKARVALRDGKPAEALKAALTGLSSTKDNPELYYQAGDASLRLAEVEGSDHQRYHLEAVEMFSKGLSLFRYDSRLALKLALAQAAQGNYYEAVETVHYAGKLDPNSAFVPAYRGYIEYVFRYYDDAEVAFRNAIDLGGEGADIARQGLALVDKARQAAGPDLYPEAFAPKFQEAPGTSLQESPSETTAPPLPPPLESSTEQGDEGGMIPQVKQH